MKKKPALPLASESQEQRAFVKRVRMDARTNSVLFTSVPLGGFRNPREAGRLVGEGANAGCPDLLFFERRHPFVGLALEMKRLGGKLTDRQMAWHFELGRRGWLVRVAFSADEAWNILLAYVDDGKKAPANLPA